MKELKDYITELEIRMSELMLLHSNEIATDIVDAAKQNTVDRIEELVADHLTLVANFVSSRGHDFVIVMTNAEDEDDE